jgi:hypothetical protein
MTRFRFGMVRNSSFWSLAIPEMVNAELPLTCHQLAGQCHRVWLMEQHYPVALDVCI